MKNILFLYILIHCIAAQPAKYTLQRCFEVHGRQGIAVDSEYYYVSGSKSLYKYTKSGKLVTKNTEPFAQYKIPCNHIGDIDV